MKVIQSKGIGKAVILLKILDNKQLLAVDMQSTIRFFDKNDLTLKGGFKVNMQHKYYKNSVISFSDNGDLFSVVTSKRNESKLFSTKTKKVMAQVDRHHGEVSCVGIDPLNRYMFSCGDDGKTFAIDIKSGKLVFTLPVHVDTVNDIAFSKNGNWVATASYDRKISIFSLVTMTQKDKLKAHASAVMKLKFIKENRLISIDKNSSAIIWNIYTNKVIERLQGIHDDVRQMVTSTDDKFLFLGTALGYVLVYDLDTYELLSSKYIKITSSITAMEFDEETNTLLLGTEDGAIFLYDIYEGEAELKTLLQHKQFTEIQQETEKNPILRYTEIYKLANNFWDTILEKAKIYLQNGSKDKAILILKTFKDVPSKNRIIQKLMSDYSEFEKFARFAKEGKLPLAYSLANTYPIYKESKIYIMLEQRWKKVFIQAQKYVLDPKGAAKAKEIFNPYRGISEKTKLIQDLLSLAEVYRRFRAAMGQKDFTMCFELIKQHKFLKEIPEYETLMKYADTLYLKSQEFIRNDNTHSAVKMLRILSVFEDFKDEVKILMIDIETKQKFFNAIEAEDIASAYNMMAISEDLEETPEGEKLQSKWYSDQLKANDFAVLGDANGIKQVFNEYMHISSKITAIATLFAWCYMVQLEDKVKENTPQLELEKGIKNFILNFGLQDQIENFYIHFMENHPSSKLTLEHLNQGSMSMWRPSMIVSSILD